MRLISCHIENFGKLSQFDAEFSEGLNVICEENGWGKSTLAAFIKAMLYGLDGSKKHSVTENERMKFKPWQGGIFGGRLEFEAGGKCYSASRVFGDTPVKDRFELRDMKTNLPSKDYSSRLGEELFKIDSASFYRSIFIGQSDCPTCSTADIHAKIGNLADNTGDLNNYDAAEAKLTSQINKLTPNRSTGSLSRLKGEITDLTRKVAEGGSLAHSIAGLENELADKKRIKRNLTETCAELQAIQSRLARQQEMLAVKKEWELRKSECDEIKTKLDLTRNRFPSEIPGQDDVNEQLNNAIDMKKTEELRHLFELTDEETRELSSLIQLFDDNPPSLTEIDRLISDEQKLSLITSQYDRLKLSPSESKRLSELSGLFAQDQVNPSRISARWNERCGKKNALSSKQAAFTAVKASVMSERASKARLSAILCAGGILLILSGAAVCASFSLLSGLLCAAVGLAVASAGVLLFLRLKHSDKENDLPQELLTLQNEIRSDTEFISSADAATADYLAAHGRNFDESYASVMLQDICREYGDLSLLREKAETAERFRRSNDTGSLSDGIFAFLKRYGMESDGGTLSYRLHKLRIDAVTFDALSEKKRKSERAENEYRQLHDQVIRFLTAYGFDGSGDIQTTTASIRDLLSEYNGLSAQYSRSCAKRKAFEAEHDCSAMEDDIPEESASLEEINGQIRSCTDSLEHLNSDISSLEHQIGEKYRLYEQFEKDQSALRQKKELLAADQLRYERLEKAKDYLRTAKETMTAKYVDPIYRGFRKYYELLADLPADRYQFNANAELSVDEQGMRRELVTLSAGFRDLAGIGMRLAFADAMFHDEKPMLIMDDPFTNLDDRKIAASKKLLSAVADNYQLIYFTCSSART